MDAEDAIDKQFEAIVQRTLSIKLKQQLTVELTHQTLPNQSTQSAASTDLTKEDHAHQKHLVGSFEIWAHGVAAVIGGIYYGWNASLTVGFGSYFVGQVLMGMAYSVLVCGLCEVVSSTAFSGGSYGMARVVLGFYPGFMMAMAEVFEYCVYTSLSAAFIGDFIVAKLHLDVGITPVIWLAFYISATSIVLAGGKIYWRIIVTLGCFSLFIVCLYCFAALPATNLPRYASLHVNEANPRDMSNWFTGGMTGFLKILAASTAAFGGIESTVLMTDCCKNPKVDLPRGLVAAMYTLFASIVVMVIISCACPPGLINGNFANLSFFMNAGFAAGGLGFNGNVSEWILLPSQYAMAFGFIWPGSKLLHTISQSNLFPRMSIATTNKSLTWLQSDEKCAVLIFCLLGYLICLVGWYVPAVNFADIAILLGFLTYFSDMMAYYKLQTVFGSVQRDYRSPFGIIGAVLASLFFAVSIVGLGLLDVNSVYFVIGGIVVVSVYYFCYATYRQTFSEMEQKSLLVLHVIVFNHRKQERMRKNRAPPTVWGNFMKRVNENITMVSKTMSALFASALGQLSGIGKKDSSNGNSKLNAVAIEPLAPLVPLSIVPTPIAVADVSSPKAAAAAAAAVAMSPVSTRISQQAHSTRSRIGNRSFAAAAAAAAAMSHKRRGSIGVELGQMIPVSTQPFLISGKVNLLDYYANAIIASEEEKDKDDVEAQAPQSITVINEGLSVSASIMSSKTTTDDHSTRQPTATLSVRLASL